MKSRAQGAQRAEMPIPQIALIDRPDQRRIDVPMPDLLPIADTYTALIVDDDRAILELAERVLRQDDYRIKTALSAEDALRTAIEFGQRIDVLVTDYLMPSFNGRQLALALRAHFPNLRVVYMTGFSDALFDQRTELEGFAAFIEKPYTARGLREAVRLQLFGTLNPAPRSETTDRPEATEPPDRRKVNVQ